jgi:serine/threonine protein kinase
MKPLAPNSLIQNRYLIVHLIGKGGMGEVYLAVDQRLGSAIALKRTFFADDEMLGGAFEREARTLARLRHPVLPKVSDHFTENGEQYLVMEHIAGDDLAKRLEGAQKPFPLSWVLFWADQLLDALAYLHTHEPPIIHRDIKPQNLKLTDENHIVLLDFGLSKNTGQTKISGSSGSTGSVVGYTPHYAPMEQIRGTGTNPRSDIYSLSATLYQLMTNTVPADALTRADALLNGDPDPIKPLEQVNPEVPEEVSDVILHGMEVSQERRFSNAKEMQKSLRKAFSQMQEAMSAQTIAFSTPAEIPSSRIEQPLGLVHTPEPQKFEDADSKATQIRDDSASDAHRTPSVPVSPMQDATAQYNGPIDSPVRQADVKTEVYNTGSTPLYTPAETPAATNDVPAASAETTDWSSLKDSPNGEFSADATVANMAFDAVSPSSPFTADESFSAPSRTTDESFATRTESPGQDGQSYSSRRPVAQPAQKKKSSKAIWVVGGLAVLFIVGVVAAGAGWFVYNNYYASAVVAPTPSPEPTLEITPTPEPTFEAITNSNSNTSTSEVETNTNSNTEVLTVAPTPTPESETTIREPGVRPTPQIEARKTPGKANTAPVAVKPTPKKSDRTVILQ